MSNKTDEEMFFCKYLQIHKNTNNDDSEKFENKRREGNINLEIIQKYDSDYKIENNFLDLNFLISRDLKFTKKDKNTVYYTNVIEPFIDLCNKNLSNCTYPDFNLLLYKNSLTKTLNQPGGHWRTSCFLINLKIIMLHNKKILQNKLQIMIQKCIQLIYNCYRINSTNQKSLSGGAKNQELIKKIQDNISMYYYLNKSKLISRDDFLKTAEKSWYWTTLLVDTAFIGIAVFTGISVAGAIAVGCPPAVPIIGMAALGPSVIAGTSITGAANLFRKRTVDNIVERIKRFDARLEFKKLIIDVHNSQNNARVKYEECPKTSFIKRTFTSNDNSNKFNELYENCDKLINEYESLVNKNYDFYLNLYSVYFKVYQDIYLVGNYKNFCNDKDSEKKIAEPAEISEDDDNEKKIAEPAEISEDDDNEGKFDELKKNIREDDDNEAKSAEPAEIIRKNKYLNMVKNIEEAKSESTTSKDQEKINLKILDTLDGILNIIQYNSKSNKGGTRKNRKSIKNRKNRKSIKNRK